MKIWYAIPTANPENCSRVFEMWKDMGYMTAALANNCDPSAIKHADLVVPYPEYPGWGVSINILSDILHDARWLVSGGDDMEPEPNVKAQGIASECEARFKGTLGVMQPHGDGFAGTRRICGSPWLGREYRQRANMGNGPMWPEYYHLYADEELYEVSKIQSLLWTPQKWSQYHRHWSRNPRGQRHRPDYLIPVKNKEGEDRAIFNNRKAQNWPGAGLAP